MPRYGDLDALKNRMFNYYECVNETTGKSNYRGETLMNYEVADMIEDCIDNAPTADVVPRSEVERLREINNLLLEAGKEWQKRYENLAREIFEEIEEARERWEAIYSPDHFGYGGGAYGYLETDVDHTIAELKKKYLPKECPKCTHLVGCEPSTIGICDEYTEEKK